MKHINILFSIIGIFTSITACAAESSEYTYYTALRQVLDNQWTACCTVDEKSCESIYEFDYIVDDEGCVRVCSSPDKFPVAVCSKMVAAIFKCADVRSVVMRNNLSQKYLSQVQKQVQKELSNYRDTELHNKNLYLYNNVSGNVLSLVKITQIEADNPHRISSYHRPRPDDFASCCIVD